MTEDQFYSTIKAKRPERSHIKIVEHTGNIGYGDKLEFVCLTHNQRFTKTVGNLLNSGGYMGCPDCKTEEQEKILRDKGQEWLRKLHNRLGHKRYEMVGRWVRSNVPVDMMCTKHKNFFHYHPVGAGRGNEACPDCFKEKYGYYRKGSFERFKSMSDELHGYEKYFLDKPTYVDFNTKMKMYCPEHDYVFWQKPSHHMRGYLICPKCQSLKVFESRSVDLGELQYKLDSKHGEGHYHVISKSKGRDKSIISLKCVKHDHLFSHRSSSVIELDNPCPICAKDVLNKYKLSDPNELINKSVSIHGDKYDYSKVEYVNSDTPVEIICKKHMESFWQTFGNHFKSIEPCPKCSNTGTSVAEREVLDFIKDHYDGEVVSNTRSIGPERHELDIYLPEKGIGIEYNGCYYHSDLMKHRNYHKIKQDYFKEQGISVFFVWDYDWNDEVKQKIIKRMILRKIGCSEEPTYSARKLNVVQASAPEVRDFLDQNHIQGHVRGSNLTYCLDHPDGERVAVMCFKLTSGEYELTRYATSGNVRGGFTKLLTAFKREVGKGVVCNSFCDLQMFDGKAYETAGFEPIKVTPPDYKVYHRLLGITHKSNWRRINIPRRLKELDKTEKVNFNPDKNIDPRSERDIQNEVNALRVFDCGKVKYQLIT